MSLHGQLANLRNIMSFPYFKGIDGLPRDWEPNYNDVIPRCMTETDSESQKHWAFLGEITHIEAAWRVRLIVKDKTGLQLPIAFYTETRGREIGASMLRVGYTVAILYASQHGFLDGTVGIRHEDPGRLQVSSISAEQ